MKKDNRPLVGRWQGLQVKGIIMPNRPTLDKIIALWILLWAIGKRFSQMPIMYYSSSDPHDPVIAQKIKEGWYPLDSGPNKYQKQGTGSAVETVCRDFKVYNGITNFLIKVANRNNQTGNLKSYAPVLFSLRPDQIIYWKFGTNGHEEFCQPRYFNWAITWLLREAHKVMVPVEQVIQHVFLVLDCWRDARKLEKYDLMPPFADYHYLFGLPKLKDLPLFSVPELLWQMAVLSFEREAIRTEIEWWLDVQRKVVEARIKARQRALKIVDPANLTKLKADGNLFNLDVVSGERGLFVGDADEFLVRELFAQYDSQDDCPDEITKLLRAIFGGKKVGDQQMFSVIIAKSPSGNVAILHGKHSMNFEHVAKQLESLESGIRHDQDLVWHFEKKGQIHQVLNGSPGWPLPPTRLTRKQLIAVVQRYTTAYPSGGRS